MVERGFPNMMQGMAKIKKYSLIGIGKLARDVGANCFLGAYRGVYALIVFMLCCFSVNSQEDNASQAAKHLGVPSCSQSTCHGSNITFADSNILRNEFRVWNENDPHARAYKTLLSADSQRIAKNLGIGSAESSDLCLGCHADNVPQEQRGDEFAIADGVSCEVCHGGGEDYLSIHTSGNHQQSLSKGLYATEDPLKRAELCVSCHVGNDSDRKITHEIMGAGHPRLSFELNTFSSIQPAHYRVDDDYVERKGNITELQIWAVGQLVAAEQFLANVKSFPKSGLFPELVHMDCLGCHQEMSNVTWTANPLTKLPAGALRYNDAYLMTSYQIAKAVVPEQASPLLSQIKGLLDVESVKVGDTQKINALQKRILSIRNALIETPLSTDQGLVILSALVDVGLASSHRDYASAEQSAMAINSVLKVLDAEQDLTRSRKDIIEGVDTLFDSLNDEDNYRPARFVRGLKQVRQVLKR